MSQGDVLRPSRLCRVDVSVTVSPGDVLLTPQLYRIDVSVTVSPGSVLRAPQLCHLDLPYRGHGDVHRRPGPEVDQLLLLRVPGTQHARLQVSLALSHRYDYR